MIEENENPTIEPALNGDEPTSSVEDVSVEPNGSDTQERVAAPEPVVSEEPPARDALAAAEVVSEPEPAPEPEPPPVEMPIETEIFAVASTEEPA
ncbi:MAG: VWA domain-containing protein, partial [Actinomycetota bacterium]